MTDCEQCIAARNAGPCPHDAVLLIERYGREQYVRGLRVGFDAMLNVLGALQTNGSWRKHVLSILRSSLIDSVRRLAVVNYPLSEQWKAEAREAFVVDNKEPTQ